MRRLRLTPLRLTALLPAGALAFAGVAYAASLPLTSGHLFASTQSLTKATCGSTTYDTWVNRSSPNQNNGNATTLKIRNNSGSERVTRSSASTSAAAACRGPVGQTARRSPST